MIRTESKKAENRRGSNRRLTRNVLLSTKCRLMLKFSAALLRFGFVKGNFKPTILVSTWLLLYSCAYIHWTQRSCLEDNPVLGKKLKPLEQRNSIKTWLLGLYHTWCYLRSCSQEVKENVSFVKHNKRTVYVGQRRKLHVICLFLSLGWIVEPVTTEAQPVCHCSLRYLCRCTLIYC